jgi:hypothetical protein
VLPVAIPVREWAHILIDVEPDVIKDDELRAAIASFQTQISRDFAPAWGVDATIERWDGTPNDDDAWIVHLAFVSKPDRLGLEHVLARVTERVSPVDQIDGCDC